MFFAAQLCPSTVSTTECLHSSLNFRFCFCRLRFKVKKVDNIKSRELSMGEKQAYLKLREGGKSIRAIRQTLAVASTTIWNVLKKKETTGVPGNGC